MPHAAAVEPRRRAAVAAEPGVHIATLAGVRLHADWSVLIIFALIVVNLGAGVFPAWHPAWSPLTTWATALGAALLFLASIVAHELSHALVARRHGIPVERITLFLFGGLAHMEREPDSPRAEFWIAVVGPLTSLVIGLASIALGSLLAGPALGERMAEEPLAAMRAASPLATLLLWFGPINVVLAVFNIVPGFPLDGGRVFRAIAWWATGDLTKATRWASWSGRIVAWALMAWGLGLVLGGGLVQGLWLLLIGWFLANAARASYGQLVVTESLRGVPLSTVMRTRFAAVPIGARVEDVVRELMAGDQRAFPVVDGDGRLAGLVCLEDIRKVPRPGWTTTPIADVMTPLERLTTLPTSATAEDAFRALARRGVDQIPVLDGGRPVGLVRSQDLVKWVSLQLEPGAARAAFGRG